jgi:hypothetical protein
MADKSDFSEQEWETLQKGVSGAGMLVAVSDAGFFDSFKEAGALTRHLAEARRNAASPLVQQAAEIQGTRFGLTTSREEVETETLAALRSTISLLEAKAPDDVDAYRRLVLDVARSVGEAAGGGDTAESAAIVKITEAVGGAPEA